MVYYHYNPFELKKHVVVMVTRHAVKESYVFQYCRAYVKKARSNELHLVV